MSRMRALFTIGLAVLLPLAVIQAPSAGAATPAGESAKGKVKVVYHVDGKDPDVAKYALALVHKHIEAEGGPDKIDVKVVVHGPALPLFDKETIDPELKKKFELIKVDGAHVEMCQVSMKIFGKPLESLVPGLEETLHPVAVKRIADLQAQGYLYIKP